MTQKIYCEDCAFWNRSMRPGGCSAPQNLIKKNYENLVTRRSNDPYQQRWKSPEFMRRHGLFLAKLYHICGRDARWFVQASSADIQSRFKR